LKKWAFWGKGKISQKKFLWGLIGVTVIILIYIFGRREKESR
jgi:hypothetical protein